MACRPAPRIDDFFLEVVTHLCHVQIFKHSTNASKQFSPRSALARLDSSPWQKQLNDYLSKFDLRYDLGGLTFAKVWGLATLGDYTAVCATFHPGDMVEYTITSVETATIVFGLQELDESGSTHRSHLPWAVGGLHPRNQDIIYSEIVSSVLAFTREGLGKLCKRIVYAAACAGVLLSTVENPMVNLCENAFRWLARQTGADMTEELNLCTKSQEHHTVDNSVKTREAANLIVNARSKAMLESDQLQSVLEMCEVCGEGIGWYSNREARCAAGHSFGTDSPQVDLSERETYHLAMSSTMRPDTFGHTRARHFEVL